MLKKLGLTLLIAGLTVGASLAQDATLVPTPASDLGVPQATVTGGDEDSLRAFILRYIVGTSPGQAVNAMIGALPTDLPFTVATPPTATLYGTVARMGQGNGPSYYDIALDTPDSPQAVIDFYKQAFTGEDWLITNESVPPASGFGGASNGFASFCYQQGAATVTINAYNEGRGTTNVNVNVQTPGDIYSCSPSQGPVNDPVMALIPSLALPQDVVVTANSGGGLSYYQPQPMGRSYSVSAVLESPRPLTDIANDYNAQLAAAGWQQISTENSERTALSTWSVTDETGQTWHGSLLILADNDPNTYNALIYVEE